MTGPTRGLIKWSAREKECDCKNTALRWFKFPIRRPETPPFLTPIFASFLVSLETALSSAQKKKIEKRKSEKCRNEGKKSK